MQEAIIVSTSNGQFNYLKTRLKEGWKVVQTCSMPSSTGAAVGQLPQVNYMLTKLIDIN